MANFIHTLQADKAALAAEVAALRAGLRDLLAHVDSAKFQGDGNQWIATGDVVRFVHRIEAEGTEAAESSPPAGE